MSIIWDGMFETRPPLFEEFTYKETKYRAICVGETNFVINTENFEPTLSVTVLYFPGQTGDILSDVLVKSGFVTAKEMADKIEKGDANWIADKVEKFLTEAAESPKKSAWLRSKGIELDDYIRFQNEMIRMTIRNLPFRRFLN